MLNAKWPTNAISYARGHIAAWDGPQLMTTKPEADIFEENGPLNGAAVLQLTITLSRVSTINTTTIH